MCIVAYNTDDVALPYWISIYGMIYKTRDPSMFYPSASESQRYVNMSELQDLVAELMGGDEPAVETPQGRKNRRKRKNPDFSAAPVTKRSQQDTPRQQSVTKTSSSSSGGGDTGGLPSPVTAQNKTLPPGTPIQRIGVDLPWSCPIPVAVQQQQIPTFVTPPQAPQPYWMNSMAGQSQYTDTPRPGQQGAYGVKPNEVGRTAQEVRLSLGDDVFLTVGLFKDKPLVSVRLFYRPDPTNVNKLRPGRIGMTMTPLQWETLKTHPLLGAILDCTYAAMPIDMTAFPPKTFDLGGKRYATVQLLRGQPVVSLTQVYKRYGAPDTEPVQRKGIDLTLEQWQSLENNMEAVDKVLAGMDVWKDSPDTCLVKTVLF
ncbi:uncharacterized protein LOC144863829 [Branchiostoma floridae x Branchiostoma japonicum]